MLRGHVYIVNEETLPIHLGHMFVGTNAGDSDNNISLLADMLRVKQGDFVFFYIEASLIKKGRFLESLKLWITSSIIWKKMKRNNRTFR